MQARIRGTWLFVFEIQTVWKSIRDLILSMSKCGTISVVLIQRTHEVNENAWLLRTFLLTFNSSNCKTYGQQVAFQLWIQDDHTHERHGRYATKSTRASICRKPTEVTKLRLKQAPLIGPDRREQSPGSQGWFQRELAWLYQLLALRTSSPWLEQCLGSFMGTKRIIWTVK